MHFLFSMGDIVLNQVASVQAQVLFSSAEFPCFVLSVWLSCVGRWIYGNIVNAAMEHFIEQQQELRDGKDRDSSIFSLYEQIACQWRTLQSYTDKRNRLDELRKHAKVQFDHAQRLQEDPRKCSKEQACQFLEAVVQSCGSNLGEGQPVLHISKAVIETLRRNVQLTQEASNRWVQWAEWKFGFHTLSVMKLYSNGKKGHLQLAVDAAS